MAESIFYCHKFIKDDPKQEFLRNLESTIAAWSTLAHVTTLSSSHPITELNVTPAVLALHHVISGKEERLPPRFGYFQLLRFFEILEGCVKRARMRGEMTLKPGQRDETKAIDIYISSMEVLIDTKIPRSHVWKLKRFGERWRELVGQSVFLLPIFSRTAETFV